MPVPTLKMVLPVSVVAPKVSPAVPEDWSAVSFPDRHHLAALRSEVQGLDGRNQLLALTDLGHEQAMARINDGIKPYLIITDINMPKMDGIALIREVRKVLRFTPILTLTTESQQAKRDEAKKLGASGWLVKPVGGADLVKVIRQVLPGA